MCPSEIGIIVLIIIIGVAVSIMIKGQAVKEGFVDQPKQTKSVDNFPNITFCPFNSTAITTYSGETLCCKGETSKKLGCLEKTVCSLSNSTGKNYGPCSKVYGEYIKNMSKYCPRNMPKYFEKRDPSNKDIINQKGCYEGATHPNKYEPVSAEQKKCIMYNSWKESEFDVNSCWNQSALSWEDGRAKKFNRGKVQLVVFNKNAPPLIQYTKMVKNQTFGNAIEMPEITYNWASIVRYWKYTWPDYYKFNFDDLTAEQFSFVETIALRLSQNTINKTDKKLYSRFLRNDEFFPGYRFN